MYLQTSLLYTEFIRGKTLSLKKIEGELQMEKRERYTNIMISVGAMFCLYGMFLMILNML